MLDATLVFTRVSSRRTTQYAKVLGELPTSLLLLPLGLVIAWFAWNGVHYWSRTHFDYAKCVFGGDSCSGAFGAYLLVIVTALAAIAAYRAARYAFQTYEVAQRTLGLESSCVLSVERCRDDSHLVAEQDVVLRGTLHGDRIVQQEPPTEGEQTLFYLMTYEFASLGRTAIVLPEVALVFRFQRRRVTEVLCRDEPCLVHLPSLRAGRDAHVRVWIAPELLNVVSAEWAPAATHIQNIVRDKLDFHPIPAERPQFCGVRAHETSVVTLEGSQIESVEPVMPSEPNAAVPEAPQ
jgi:hypothetical protein